MSPQDFRVHPVNNTNFGVPKENEFRLDIRNTGTFWTDGKIIWDFYGKCYPKDMEFIPQKIETTFSVRSGETNVVWVQIPTKFVQNLPTLNSFAALIGIISYPYDHNLERIDEQEQYRQTVIQFDYDSTLQRWFASKAYENDVCITPEVGSYVYSFHTSDEELNYYVPRP